MLTKTLCLVWALWRALTIILSFIHSFFSHSFFAWPTHSCLLYILCYDVLSNSFEVLLVAILLVAILLVAITLIRQYVFLRSHSNYCLSNAW